MDTLVVYNPGSKNVNLTLKAISRVAPILEMSNHHRRRAGKGTVANVVVPVSHTVDLVNETGFSAIDIQMNIDFQNNIKNNRLIIVSEANKQRFVIGDPGKSVPVQEVVEEPVETVEEPVETVEEPVETIEEEFDAITQEDLIDPSDLPDFPEEVVEESPKPKNKGGRPRKNKKSNK